MPGNVVIGGAPNPGAVPLKPFMASHDSLVINAQTGAFMVGFFTK
jgi:hypothetical protein